MAGNREAKGKRRQDGEVGPEAEPRAGNPPTGKVEWCGVS